MARTIRLTRDSNGPLGLDEFTICLNKKTREWIARRNRKIVTRNDSWVQMVRDLKTIKAQEKQTTI